MSRLIRFCTTLIAVLLIAEVVATGVRDRIGTEAAWPNAVIDQRVSLAQTNGSTNVVFLGSSVVAAAVEPSLVLRGTGRTGLNLGLAGSPPRVLAPYLEAVVAPSTCPGVVVLGVSIRDWNDNSLNAASGLRSFEESRGYREIVGRLSATDQIEGKLANVANIVAIRPYLFQPKDFLNSLRWAGARPMSPEGLDTAFYGSMSGVEPAIDLTLRDSAFHDFAVGGVEEDAVRAIHEYLLSIDSRLVVVDMPVLQADLVESLPRGQADWDDYQNSVEQLVDELGVAYLDLSSSIEDRGLFSNAYHLNSGGVTAVSELLALGLATVFANSPKSCSR